MNGSPMAPDNPDRPSLLAGSCRRGPQPLGALWIYSAGFMVHWSMPGPLIQGHFATESWIYSANPASARGRVMTNEYKICYC
jgi:hypothetical protein